jgi:hypothetical protein
MALPLKILITAFVCWLFCAGAAPYASDRADYCASMYRCLGETPKGCSEEAVAAGDVPETETYCDIFRDLQERGLRAATFRGRQIYRQISGKHRVEYAQSGTLPMPAEVLVYLMNNLPFAAQLVNAYQGTEFKAAYLDAGKRRFTGSGERLSGTFDTVLQNDNQTGSLYYGYGKADILAWSLRGTALFMFDFEETGPREITYSARCFVFPRSAFVRSILNFILFRRSITGEIKNTFGYVEDSALAFHRGEYEPIENYPAFATPEGRRQIEQFQALLRRTMTGAETPP